MIIITIRKHHIIAACAVFVFGLVFTLGFFISDNVFAALSCSVSTSCVSPGVVVFRMASTSNSHSELPSQSNPNYSELVCCTSVTGLSNSCSDTYAIVARLSSTTNAHLEQNDESNYPESACLSVPAGGTVSVGYQDTNCSGFDTTVASISSSTNAHTGDGNAYTRKICASATQPGLTFVVDSDSEMLSVTPGSLAATTSILYAKSTNPSGFNISVQKASATTLQLQSDPTVVIPDKTEWIAPPATTTPASTTASSTEPYSLQFRLRQADTDASNFASAWWGADDTSSGALFAGFPTTTQKIVDRSTPTASTSTATVLYNLSVDLNQENGTYSGTITYSATVNP